MNALANLPRILLVDSNVYFAKRVGEALQQVGFEVVPCTQAAYALTMLEWNAPAAILCATNLREMGALEMAPILRADPQTAHIPLIAIGGAGAGDQALLEAYRAGCDDYVDRRRAPSDIAAHVRSFLVSRQNGFQPTQMLSSAETDLSGSLSHLDLARRDSNARPGPPDRRVAHQCGRYRRNYFLRGRGNRPRRMWHACSAMKP